MYTYEEGKKIKNKKKYFVMPIRRMNKERNHHISHTASLLHQPPTHQN